MATEEGIVFKMGASGAGTAWVKTTRSSACESCSSRHACHADSAGKEMEVEAVNTPGARPGDFVEFDLPGHLELKVSLLVWSVPLAGLIAGAVAGNLFHEALSLSRDPATLLGAGLGLALAFACVRVVDRRAARGRRLVPHILRVVRPEGCPEQGNIPRTTPNLPDRES